MNYREAYINGKRQLTAAGKDDADTDAKLLLEYACGTDKNTLFMQPDRHVTAEQLRIYEECINRRKASVPLQYITGEQYFYGLRFTVDENVLIPRQDTEILVEKVLKDGTEGMKILDLCTGSGCILIAILKASKDASGMGIDISEKALKLAAENAKANAVKAEWKVSDLYAAVDGKYDVIVSNPPYIRSAEIPYLMPEVGEHEPVLALDGGADGLDCYRKIAAGAGKVLKSGGRIYLEIGSEQAGDVGSLISENGFEKIKVLKDLAGLDRVVCGILK